MYNKNDIEILHNEIIVKIYDGTETNGVKHFTWKTLIEVHENSPAKRHAILRTILHSITI